MTSATGQPETAPSLELRTPVQFLPGVGPKRAASFARLGVETLADLLKHVPMRYEYEHSERPIRDLAVDQIVSVRGEVAATRLKGQGRRARFETTLTDGTDTLLLTWFNSPFLSRKIHPGMRLLVQGTTKRYGPYLQMVNAKWKVLDGVHDEPERSDDRIRPVYPATEDLPSAQIEKIIGEVLDAALPLIEDHLPESYRRQRELPGLADAYRMIHRPATQAEVDDARRRLAFDELMLLQIAVAMRRHQLRDASQAPALKWNEAIHDHIASRFPFTLTPAQQHVIREIRDDVVSSTPMNRLLQGDVGSGKTVVAVYAMLLAVAAGWQAALMAPTELLAEQHHESITGMLGGSNVKIELLTGRMSASERESIRRRLAEGEIDIVVGTHALLSESVSFDRLGLVVIDEQHRFGVEQRAALRERAGESGRVPHTLVMTATPIPRTLSLTLFGDLDVSVIKTLPPGRTPIVTRVVGPDKTDVVYEYVAQRLREGEQAYVVVPAIEESASELKDVRRHAEWLESGPFKDLKVATIHGRMKRETRERIMYRFRLGQIHALVATTVIEVGIDVPNATVMIVEHAERFGLSQLHQLRGRVGRGEKKSLCVFIGDPSTPDAAKRLEAIGATGDGFEIAEKDFEIRGMGEIFGTRQSGLPPFRVVELPRDMELLQLARRDARAIVQGDPYLKDPAHDLLRKRVLKAHGRGFGIGDVG